MPKEKPLAKFPVAPCLGADESENLSMLFDPPRPAQMARPQVGTACATGRAPVNRSASGTRTMLSQAADWFAGRGAGKFARRAESRP